MANDITFHGEPPDDDPYRTSERSPFWQSAARGPPPEAAMTATTQPQFGGAGTTGGFVQTAGTAVGRGVGFAEGTTDGPGAPLAIGSDDGTLDGVAGDADAPPAANGAGEPAGAGVDVH